VALSERSRNGGVDEIPLPFAPDRLWLAGKHFVGPDPDAALARTGAAAIVCLNELTELEDRYPAYVQWLLANQPDRALWRPIPDMHAPAPAAAAHLLAELHERLEAGDGLLVHCGAGIGRAGTVAAALLVTSGVPLPEALRVVRAHRPMAGPEVGSQLEMLERLAAEAQSS
jgi:protein-tyrosine phosphatase